MGRSRRTSLGVAAPWLLVAFSSLSVTGDGAIIRKRCTREGHSGFLVCSASDTPPQRQRHDQEIKPPTTNRSLRSQSLASVAASGRTGAMAWAQPSSTISSSLDGGRNNHQRTQRPSVFRSDSQLWSSSRRHIALPISATTMDIVPQSNRVWGRDLLPMKTMTLRGGGFSGNSVGAGATPTRGKVTHMLATVSAPAGATGAASPSVEIIKPELDERVYRYITLPNGLGVMLVSDSRTETAAASMFIRVGHMQDPRELAGLAHFHEHMVFLGTEKYPEEGDFENFLTQHGGSSNAYTAAESTNYYFNVDSRQLRGAVDRFAQFFRCPLFTESSMERELQAVESEHSNNKNDDSWRLFQVLKTTSNPAHPFSKFGSGNYETLRPRLEDGINTRASLAEFHEKFYSANTMKLCVLGKEDLDTLEDWVRELFSGVRNTSPPPPQLGYGSIPAFGEGELGREVTVVPLKEARQLGLSWPLPPRSDHKRSKPTVYVSHLLGYEGEGSLHALLHSRGWISGLHAGSLVTGTDFQLFRLGLTLTKEGERHTDEIIELCHRFIALLRSEPPQKRIQDELAAMGAIRFRFMEKSSPTSAVQNIANALGEDETPPAEVLSDSYTIPKWDSAAITDVLKRLTPRNCQILLVSKKYDDDRDSEAEEGGWETERWYGTKYRVRPLSEERLRHLETLSPTLGDQLYAPFSLPGPNSFIPSEFGLRFQKDQGKDDGGALMLPETVPSLALETVPVEDWSRLVPPALLTGDTDAAVGGARGGLGGEAKRAVNVWHKMDRSHRVPRLSIAAKLWTPEPYGSPRAAVMSKMFVRLLKEDLKSWAYDAALADLRYSLEMTTHGLQLSVGGFSSKVALLLAKILGHIGELLEEYRALGELLETGGEGAVETKRQRLLLQRFETARQSFLRSYRNVAKEQPYETAAYYIRQVVEAEVWHISEYQGVLEDDQESCTPFEMTRNIDSLLGKMHVDLLAHGNIDEAEASALAPMISAALSEPQPLPEDELPTRHALRLPGRGEAGDEGVVIVDLEAGTEEEKNSAVQVYLQLGPGEANLDLAAALEMINNIGYTSAFQRLRTQEQLGYVVYTQVDRAPPGKVKPWDGKAETEDAIHPGGPLAWSVVVQSPDKSPAELEERIEAWIAGFREELEGMSDEVFEATKASMSSMVLRRERSMREEASVYFSAIASRNHDFYRRYRKAEAYRRLTKEALLSVYDESLAPNAPGRRKLTVRVASRRHARDEAGVMRELEGKEVDSRNHMSRNRDHDAIVLRSLEDIRDFKSRTPVYE